MQTLSLTPGSLARCRGRNVVVLDFVDLDTVLVEFDDAASRAPVRIDELSPPSIEANSPEAKRLQRLAQEALPLITDQRWREARERLDALRPLLRRAKYLRDVAEVKAVAEKLNRSVPTVYRWLERYESTRSVQSLMRVPRNDRDRTRLGEHQERLMREAISEQYLLKKKSIASVVEEVRKKCFRAGVEPPHSTTVARRIQKLDPETKTRARLGRKAAKERHELRRGAYPDVEHPLAHAQIDHTPADYCIVDEVHRLPLDGSPTLTVCVDVHTKCVLGFTLSLEAPCIRLAGECVIHSLLRKEKFLEDQNVQAEWPCYGVFALVMADNASEFEAPDFVRACNAWGIDVRKRPKGAPNYAGLIESTFRTFLNKVHEVEGGRQPGTGQRSMAYDIKGRPVMTLGEFRRWMTIFITKYYHLKPHSGLNDLPPIEAWRRGILGWEGKKGIGLPRVISDEMRLRIDFLRSDLRTIQDYGIRFANQTYSGDILRQWVGSRDPENPTRARKFTVKYDQWDISEIYFLDPSVGTYFPLQSSAQLSHITYWENKQLGIKQKKANRGMVNEALLYEGLDEMREQVEASARTTKSARRAQQRIIESQRFSVKTRRAEVGHRINAPSTPDDEPDGPLVPLPGARVARLSEN